MLSRIKFSIEELVNDILDHLPADVWTSTTTTFCDPSIGGGQFVREIERRLREAGHTDENIKSRVFGFESSALSMGYAINRYGLVGTYEVCDFLEKEYNGMKFDVVVGNPPYQTGFGEKGGKHSLWRKFVKTSFELLETNGYVGIVCPGFPYLSDDLKHYFKNNTPVLLCNDATSYFPKIGSEIKYWIYQQGKHNKPFIVDGNYWKDGLNSDPTIHPIVLSILDKIKGLPTFECKQDRGYNSTQFKNDNTDYLDKPTKKCPYQIRHSSTNKVCYVSRPTSCHYKNKVMMTFSGYPDFEYFCGKTNPMSSCYQMSGYIEVKNKKEGDALISLYTTNFYKFLSSVVSKTAGMRGIRNYTLPLFDLSKPICNEEIYTHFNLTQEEIDYVEANTK